jgi:hypothetical protein
MKNIIDNLLCKTNCWLKGCTLTSILLIILGIFLPPLGVVDNSIIIAVGEILGFATLGEGVRIIQAGHDAKIKIKELELSVQTKNGEL